jgi:hypothetical protein
MNRAAGEEKVVIDGTEFILRPTFEAFQEIEELADCSIVDMMLRAKKSLRIKDIVAILVACANAAENPKKLSKEELAKLFMKKVRYSAYGEPCVRMLIRALTPEDAQEKKTAETPSPLEAESSGTATSERP